MKRAIFVIFLSLMATQSTAGNLTAPTIEPKIQTPVIEVKEAAAASKGDDWVVLLMTFLTVVAGFAG